MKRFLVRGVMSMPCATIVSASNPEQAKALARKRRVGLNQHSVDNWEITSPATTSGEGVEVVDVIETG